MDSFDGRQIELQNVSDYAEMRVVADSRMVEQKGTIVGHEALYLMLQEYKFETVLDIGCGRQEHAAIMRAMGKRVTTLDPVFPADISQSYLDYHPERQFDAIHCSHVIEHQRNVGSFLDKVFDDLKDGGVCALSVPPIVTHWITFTHCNWFNAGMLLYHMVMAGFDCRKARTLVYGYNQSVIVEKKANGLPRGPWALEEAGVRPFLPECFEVINNGFDGAVQAIEWSSVLGWPPHDAAGIK